MEMNHNTCGCPGLKLGHNKTPTSTTSPAPHDNRNTVATAQKRINVPNHVTRVNNSFHRTQGTFKLPGYEPTKLDRLPASPQTLFKKDQLLSMLQDFARHMYDTITTNGIHVPPSIKIGLNSSGDIHVLGHHPDQGKIESLFGSQSSLALQLHQIAFTSRAQQLADLQPGFKGDFFKFPANSIQQITFVHMRAVVLSPFSMTIDQPGNVDAASNTANSAVGNQGQTVSLSFFHMVISRSKGMSALPSTPQQQTPATPIDHKIMLDDPKPANPTPGKPWQAAIHPIATGHGTTPVAKDPEITLDDPVPTLTTQDEPHTVGKHHHVHKGKLRCVINK